MVGFMSLHNEVINYFNRIRNDAQDPQRIDKLKALVESYQSTPLEETRQLSKKMSRAINLLFKLMPEVDKADADREKVYPLCDYCENLPKSIKTLKSTRR
jgi:hypothetical protein